MSIDKVVSIEKFKENLKKPIDINGKELHIGNPVQLVDSMQSKFIKAIPILADFSSDIFMGEIIDIEKNGRVVVQIYWPPEVLELVRENIRMKNFKPGFTEDDFTDLISFTPKSLIRKN